MMNLDKTLPRVGCISIALDLFKALWFVSSLAGKATRVLDAGDPAP